MSGVDTENVTAHLSSLQREEVRREKQVIDNVVAVLADGNRPFTRSDFWDDPKLTHFEKIGLELDKVLARPRAANPARQPSSGSKRRRNAANLKPNVGLKASFCNGNMGLPTPIRVAVTRLTATRCQRRWLSVVRTRDLIFRST